MSTFHGLEMAKRALFAQQSALYTTGNNISNTNTEGYSRQRVNFETLPGFPTASRNRPQMPGQMGTGVDTGTVQRIRDQYLDYQYRTENSKNGYWETKSGALGRMEELMNELSENGLSKTMDQFWQSLQDLAVNPENSGARSVVAQRGLAVAETFNYLSDSLHSIRSDQNDQINVTVKDANSIIEQVDSINKQIKDLEVHGYLANDLYDERDRLIDELSGMINIKVTYTGSGGGSLAIADGLATIEVVDNDGKTLSPAVKLVDGEQGTHQTIDVSYANEDQQNAVTDITVGDTKIDITASNGSLKAFVEAYGYVNPEDRVVGEFPDMLADLDRMAAEFAKAFNKQHKAGNDLNGEDGEDFFVNADSARTITVNQQIVDNPDLIAAASKDEKSGDGENASALGAVFHEELPGLGKKTSVKSFYESLIGELGVQSEKANRMTENTTIIRSQIEQQRMSVSGVSLDEEMSNMIKFQHAYNAAARSMTAIDEMLDRIINNMGLVGR
ncbi:flagellar hook-associated protein FlgK [Lentibacillus sp. N15]|uniref:flagellar hook-associated protein FlgK n=1 Tax=Lentibacillus songyuanensis TaxID=3136161 RepID=UPI0031BA772D